MNITNDLDKLAVLYAEGKLTAEEFAIAKGHLLQAQPVSRPENANQPVDENPPDERVFRSSRWSAGNRIFPDSLTIAADGIVFRKRGVLGSNEEHINYQAVASCRIKNGIFLANLAIESTGGSQPIYVHGLWRSEAKAILDVVRSRSGRR